MNKIFLATTAAIALVACNNGNQQQQQSKEPEAYPVIIVGEQNTVSYLSYPVNIEGVVNSDVQAKISGYITKVLVDEGQVVTQGQPLFQLETQTLNQSAASAKAAVDVAKVEVDKLVPLVQKNIVSPIQLATAKANLQRAQATYNEVASNIGFAVVKAPVNGVVGAINYREGALVTANNTVLTTVSDVKEVYAYFSMNEKEYLDFLDNTQGKTTAEKLKNLPAKKLNQLANCPCPMRNLIFYVGPKFGKCFVVTIGNKQRIVTKAFRSMAFGGDMSLYYAFKKHGFVYAQRVIGRSNKRNYSAKTGFAMGVIS